VKAFLLGLLLIALFVSAVAAIELPPAPSGFTWQEIPELRAAFLRPNGWFFKRENNKGTLAYLISKESIESGGEFQTGLTVNVFHLKKDPAVERGKYMIDQLAANKHGEKWNRDVGPFKEFGCLVEDTDATGTNRDADACSRQPQNKYALLFHF
jgi:hypothetical protein